ncbi:MAG: cation:proton antiporter [Hyphomicrobiales bacterium]|nr:cation:proton antiporter [Hyphomicrobiales bacterium]
MFLFESILALLALSLALAAVSRRIGAPYPAFLALLGVALAVAPRAPHVELDPELALALFLAPVLVDAGFDMSIRDLKRDWIAVTSLVVGAVIATTIAVAFVARWFEPGMPWPAAIALGAIVAPPDAVAASAVLKHVAPPRRLVAILEGESLFNDASALVIFRAAVVAAAMSFSESTIPMLAASVPVSIAVGAGVGYLLPRLISRIVDAPTSIIAQFVAAFGIWIAAEHVHLSGVLTLVAFAATASRVSQMPARLRLPSFAVWETVVFLANVLAFVLIGLQLAPILDDLTAEERIGYLSVGSAVLATIVAVRFGWVFLNGAGVVVYGRLRGFSPINPAVRPNWRSGLVVSWCGMRGIVTLAAALSLPNAFPFRNLVVFCAFFVVLGTLVLQGFTLGPLLRALDLPEDRQFDVESGFARTEAIRAALASLQGKDGEASARVRAEYEGLLAVADADPDAYAPAVSKEDRLRERAISAARQRLDELRRNGEIGDDAFHRIEEELDRSEIGVIEL